MVEWGGWKAAALFIDEWGTKRTDPANKKTKDKLFKPNRVALEEPRQKNIINSKGTSIKNSNSSHKKGI